MRLIHRSRSLLHVWSVQDYIKQTQSNLHRQDTQNFLSLHTVFNKLYLRHLTEQRVVDKHANRLNGILLMGQTPAHSIVTYFHKTSRRYSPGLLRATFDALGKAYQVGKADHNGSLDHFGYMLFHSTEFTNLAEELKYALRNDKLNMTSVLAIVDSLIKLEYVDNEIFSLLILLLDREFRGKRSGLLDNWEGDRPFQIEKKNYYNPSEADVTEAIKTSSEMSTALGFVRHFYNEFEAEKQMRTGLQTDEIKELDDLVEDLAKTSTNFRKLVESIINIRSEYLRMVQLSGQDSILKNPNLNLELLKIQEKMLGLGLLNMNDIREPNKIKDSSIEVPRIEEILLSVLDSSSLDPVFSLVDREKVEVYDDKELINPCPERISLLLDAVAQLAQLDKHVYNAEDGRSCLSLKWQKTLIEQSGATISKNPIYETLKVSRIFRRSFAETVKVVLRHQSTVEKLFDRCGQNERIKLMSSLCRLGLHEMAIEQLPKLETLNSQDIEHCFFESLMRVVSDIGIFSQNEQFKKFLFLKIEQIQERQKGNHFYQPLETTIDLLNYLIQNHRQDPRYPEVYQGVLEILEAKAVYMTPHHDISDAVVQAFRILALEMPDRYASHPIYLQYLEETRQNKHKKNPYYEAVQEAVVRWSQKSPPKFTDSAIIPMGLAQGQPTALMISHADETSLTGDIRTGSFNAQLLRFELYKGIKMQELSIASLLEIDFEKENPFTLKPVSYFKAQLEEIFAREEKPFDESYSQVKAMVLDVLSVCKETFLSDRIQFQLAAIDKLLAFDPVIETPEQEFNNKAKVLLQVFQLQKLISLVKHSDLAHEAEPKAAVNYSYNKALPSLVLNEQTKQQIKNIIGDETLSGRQLSLIIQDLSLGAVDELSAAAIESKLQNPLALERARNIVQSGRQESPQQEQDHSSQTEGSSQQFSQIKRATDPNADRDSEKVVRKESHQSKPSPKVAVLSKLKDSINELVSIISSYLHHQSGNQKASESGRILQGQRQTIQSLEPVQDQEGEIDITVDILNHSFYADKTYCEYGDWLKKVQKKYYCAEISYNSASNIAKILMRQYLQPANKIAMMPLNHQEDRVKKIPLEFTVFQEDLQQKRVQEYLHPEQSNLKQVDEIVNLQNFKHELKTTKKPEEVAEMILEFSFVDKLTAGPKPQALEAVVLERDGESYLAYWQELEQKAYLDSPYTRYILSKLGRADQVRYLLEARKDKRVELRVKYQKGMINGDAYYEEMDKVDSQILTALDKLKDKLVDSQEDKLLENEFKMIEIKQEELEVFGNMLRRHFGYSRHFDQDFIAAKGDLAEVVKLKRGRAQVNFTRFNLLNRLSKGKRLKFEDKKKLDEWHQDIVRSINESVVYTEHTWMQVSDLPWADLQRIRLESSHLTMNRDMLVIDLVMELNHFLNPALLEAYEQQVKAHYLLKNCRIPPELFSSSKNIAFSRYAIQAEESILQKHSVFTPEQLSRMEDMFRIYKTEGYNQRNRYAELCKDFSANLQAMNQQSIRNELIEEYVKHLEGEFLKEYSPARVDSIKQKETDKLWREIFTNSYNKCDAEGLKQKTRKLLLRLELIGSGNTPPFLGNILINLIRHPKLDPISRQSVIGSIETNGINLDLDSQDIVSLASGQAPTVRSIEEVMADLKRVSGRKVAEILWRRGMTELDQQ